MTSVVNSTNVPLLTGGAFSGAYELVKNYVAISVLCICDSSAELVIHHSTNGTDVDYEDYWQIGSNTPLFKQVVLKSKYVKVVVTNSGVSDQSYLRLYTKLMVHSNPDQMHMTLDENDSISVRATNSSTGLSSPLYVDGDGKLKCVVSGLSTDGLATEATLSTASGKLDTLATEATLTAVQGSLSSVDTGIGNVNSNAGLCASALEDIRTAVATETTLDLVKTAVDNVYSAVNSLAPTSVLRNVAFSLSSTPGLMLSAPSKLVSVIANNESNSIKYLRLYDKATLPDPDTDSMFLVIALNHSVGSQQFSLHDVSLTTGLYAVVSENKTGSFGTFSENTDATFFYKVVS